jgi:hypothetical protein
MLMDRGLAAPAPAGRARSPRSLSAFGLAVEVDFPLPGTHSVDGRASENVLALTLVPWRELAPLIDEARVLRHLRSFDDCPYAMLEGSAGDILFDYGHRALFHLSADGSSLRCACARVEDRTWQRVLLDTVLWTTSLLRGFELLHASAVETANGLVAFAATSGGGKTSLAAEYLRRGAALFCDDILALEAIDGQVIGHPGPPFMNLPARVPAASVGGADVIALFGDEQWVEIEAPPVAAQPVSAIVLIERAPGMPARCSMIDATSLTLLPHAAGLPHLRHRTKRCFEVFGELAATATVCRLTADPAIPGQDLADLVDEALTAR